MSTEDLVSLLMSITTEDWTSLLASTTSFFSRQGISEFWSSSSTFTSSVFSVSGVSPAAKVGVLVEKTSSDRRSLGVFSTSGESFSTPMPSPAGFSWKGNRPLNGNLAEKSSLILFLSTLIHSTPVEAGRALNRSKMKGPIKRSDSLTAWLESRERDQDWTGRIRRTRRTRRATLTRPSASSRERREWRERREETGRKEKRAETRRVRPRYLPTQHMTSTITINIYLALHSRTVRRPGLQNSLEEVCVGGQLWLHLVLDLPPGEDVVQHDADYPTGLAESKVKMSLVSHDLTSFI